jgi:hypothetical protein
MDVFPVFDLAFQTVIKSIFNINISVLILIHCIPQKLLKMLVQELRQPFFCLVLTFQEKRKRLDSKKEKFKREKERKQRSMIY